MLKIGVLFIATSLIAPIWAPIAVRADTTMGQLVYHFTFSSKQAVTARDSANPMENPDPLGNLTGGNNGLSHYVGALDDKGTMTVQVLQQQPDGALVVMISEQGEYSKSARR